AAGRQPPFPTRFPYTTLFRSNHRTGKAEKCTFCFPRVEVGLPTVCAETCVGRLRYIGLVLYDVDRVSEAAATPDEQDLYDAQREDRKSTRLNSSHVKISYAVF